MKPRSHSVAVIGAGWAGCAAAVTLAGQGHTVTLVEAAKVAGGRARRVSQHGLDLDNGQHILLGAYRESLRLMKTVGINPAQSLLRLPLQMRYPPGSGGMDFIAPKLPAPLHVVWALLRAKGLSRADKLALARFSSAARWMDWQLDVDCSVTALLERFGQTDKLIQLLWRPLCIAALNTSPERASANIFLHVLRDSLGARRAASDMLLPKVDLSTLFPEAAAHYVQAHGGTVLYGQHIDRISPHQADGQNKWRVDSNACMTIFDAVVIATPPWIAARLLKSHDTALAALSFTYEPITTCYLRYAPSVSLPLAFYALRDVPEEKCWGQFVFDRGHLHAGQAGVLAVVISASSAASQEGHAALGEAVAAQLASNFQRPELKQPQWCSVITEKRATFACTPDVQRPANATACAGLFIAGDYTQSDYPATIEAAVRSGIKAAELIAAQDAEHSP